MGPTTVEKKWGLERILHNDGYCCKLLVYQKQIASSKHYHEHKHETFVVLSGKFYVEFYSLDDADVRGAKIIVPGSCLILAPRTVHQLRCLEQGIIVEASSQDDPDDCVRLVPSEG